MNIALVHLAERILLPQGGICSLVAEHDGIPLVVGVRIISQSRNKITWSYALSIPSRRASIRVFSFLIPPRSLLVDAYK